MNVTKNIGILNALIRITIGLTILSWSTAKMVKFPWRDSYLFIAICGAMKVAEGIVHFCPVTALYERYQEMEQEKPLALGDGSNHGEVDEVLPYNPT
ncbi:DUF2892 domain-containing protein [Neobacillus sp. 179-C4.2 HS]|uniref:DUF2892 domain-containing protein n=1 Tax=Neobacillus driksii TaxID=3035913 RepID=A0ABV4Z1U7_9BACI|nr:DUF2892 domain-containing protein [Neobacillus sp. 179.-C4.2 HS]MDP5195165.1 DUF2892 domain-containing protein [Neobacillus sp. 179.-C4.2 HS]